MLNLRGLLQGGGNLGFLFITFYDSVERDATFLSDISFLIVVPFEIFTVEIVRGFKGEFKFGTMYKRKNTPPGYDVF